MASNQNRCISSLIQQLVEKKNDLQEQLDKSINEASVIQDFLEDHRDTLPRVVLDVLEGTWSQLIEAQIAFEYSMGEFEHKLSKLEKDISKTKS